MCCFVGLLVFWFLGFLLSRFLVSWFQRPFDFWFPGFNYFRLLGLLVPKFLGCLLSKFQGFNGPILLKNHLCFQEDIDPISKTFKILLDGSAGFPGARRFHSVLNEFPGS